MPWNSGWPTSPGRAPPNCLQRRADGRVLWESLVILRYLDETLPGPMLRHHDPAEHALESMLIGREGPFTTAGYQFVMNHERARRDEHEAKLLAIYRDLDAFLLGHNPDGTFLYEGTPLATPREIRRLGKRPGAGASRLSRRAVSRGRRFDVIGLPNLPTTRNGMTVQAL